MRDPLSRVPIKYKLSLTFLVISLVAFGIGGFVVTTTARSALEEQIHVRLDERSAATNIVVDRHLDLVARRAEDFASDGFIRTETEALQAGLVGPEREAVEVGLRRHLIENKLPLVGAFVDAAVLDVRGAPLIHAHAAWPSPPDATRVTSTRIGSIRPPRGDHSYPTFLLATPLHSLDGRQRVGVLQLLVHAERWAEGMTELKTLPEAGLVTIELVDTQGIRLPLQRRPTATRPDDILDLRTPIARSGWELRLAVDRGAVMEPISGLLRRFLLTGGLLLAATLLVIFFPVRFLLRPLGRIAEAARRIGEGDFSTRVPSESRDEIGDLSHAFNIMAQAVEERTRKLVDAARTLQRRETDVRYERDRLDAVIRSMQDGLFILGPRGEVTLSNAAAQPLVRALERADCRAQPLDCGDNRADARSCLDCLMDVTHVHHPCVIREGNRIYEVRVTSLPGPGKPVGGRLCVSRDVTARIAEEERHSHQERMAVLGEVAAVMAHELNNPLAAIAMFGQMLESQLEPGTSLRESAEVIRRNTETCKRTIRGLLDMAARSTPETARFDLHHVLDDVERLLRPILDRAGVVCSIERGAADAEISGDEIQLRQVVVNLLLNAMQACEARGGTVHVATAERDGRLELDVRDEGGGIPADARPHIFEPFFTTKPAGVGTGLGLPTSRRIVEAHGGTLELLETGPSGSTFRISLPCEGGGAAWRASARVIRAAVEGDAPDE